MSPARTASLLAAAALALGACSSSPGDGGGAVEAATVPPTASEPAEVAEPTTSEHDEPGPANTEQSPETAPAETAPPETAPAATAPAETTPTTTTLPEDRSVAPLERPIVAVGTESGPETARAQARLIDLGFWVGGITGEYGTTTKQAVMAFQKYFGLTADGVLGPITAEFLSEIDERPSGRATGGTLVEVDKTKQLVFLVADGSTKWILNASTGTEIPYREEDQNTPGEFQEGDSVTRTGLFEVNREREEGWWEGDLGEIYRPKYFDGGIALHGSYNVPNYPASHGCVRLSIPAMDWIWETGVIPKGTPVWVHGAIPNPPDLDG